MLSFSPFLDTFRSALFTDSTETKLSSLRTREDDRGAVSSSNVVARSHGSRPTFRYPIFRIDVSPTFLPVGGVICACFRASRNHRRKQFLFKRANALDYVRTFPCDETTRSTRYGTPLYRPRAKSWTALSVPGASMRPATRNTGRFKYRWISSNRKSNRPVTDHGCNETHISTFSFTDFAISRHSYQQRS